MPVWLLAFGRRAERALAATVTIPIWLGVLVVLIAVGWTGFHSQSRYNAGLAKGAIRERAAQSKIVAKVEKRQDRVTARVERQAEKAQAKIEVRYRTLRQKVPQYVPLHSRAGVIGAGDLVPASTVLLLDAAVRGDEPEPVSVAAGATYELASPVRFDQLVGGYITNLGVGHQSARQLTDLQGWIREQQDVTPP